VLDLNQHTNSKAGRQAIVCNPWRDKRPLSGEGVASRTYREATRCRELPTNNNQVPKSDDHKAIIYRQDIKYRRLRQKWVVSFPLTPSDVELGAQGAQPL